METIYIITSGESEEYGYAIDSVWASQEAALGQCKKLYKELIALAEQYNPLRRFSLNLERWVEGAGENYRSIPCWEVAYDVGKHGFPIDEKNVVICKRDRYGKIDEVRLDGFGKRLEVWGPDKNECLQILSSLLE